MTTIDKILVIECILVLLIHGLCFPTKFIVNKFEKIFGSYGKGLNIIDGILVLIIFISLIIKIIIK